MEIDPVLRARADRIIDLALEEDLGPSGDLAGGAVARGRTATGRLLAKAPGVLAGLPFFLRVFERLGGGATFEPRFADGSDLAPGITVASFSGCAQTLLAGERTALNLLQRLSGIATAARAATRELSGTGTRLLDTRKTAPGMRALDKYAVRVGGGCNHRMGLYDLCMLKDNHVDLAGGVAAAVRAARAAHPLAARVEVECRTVEDVREAVEAGADIVMLDNFAPEAIPAAVAACAGRAAVEVSGGVTRETLRAYALPGVDFISVGALTHSVAALDLSMKFDRARPA